MNDTTTPTTTSNRTPSHVAYQVRDREGKKGIWTRIGSAWPHADGNQLFREILPHAVRKVAAIGSVRKKGKSS